MMSVNHHGLPEDVQRELKSRFVDQMFPGAERQYPAGRMGADDDGQLAYAMATDDRHRTIVIRFPKAIEWIGLDAKAAEELRDQLTERLAALRGVAVAILVLLLTGSALGQEKQPDVVLNRGEYQETYRTADRTPEGLFKLIENVVETKAQPGDDVRFRGFARNTKADQLRLHNGTFGGFGREESKLTVVNRIDVPKSTPGICLPDDSTIVDCTLQCDCYDKNEDGGLLGWGFDPNVPVDLKKIRKVTLRNVVMDGRTNGDWSLYAWDDNRASVAVTVEDCEFYFPRHGISLCNSAAKNQTLSVLRTKFYGDANWSRSYGETSSSDPDTGVLCPIVIRSGKAHIEDCEFWLTGWKSTDGKPYSGNGKFAINRIVSVVTDQYSSKVGAGTEPVVTIKNSFVRKFEGNDAPVQRDTDMRYGKATWDNSAAIASAEQEVAPQRAEAQRLTTTADAKVAAARGGSGPDGTIRVWTP